MDFRIHPSFLSRVNCGNYENDFEFEFNGASLTCPSFLAEVVSSKVSDLRRVDATQSKTNVPIRLAESCETIQKLNAHPQSVSLVEGEEVFNVLILGNGEILEMISSEITTENVFSQMQIKERNGCDTSEEVSFAAKNFEETKELPFSKCQWMSIVGSPLLKIKNELSLLSFINEKMQEESFYELLLRYVKSEFLDGEGLELFMSIVDSLDNNSIGSLWPSLKPRFSSAPPNELNDNRFLVTGKQFSFSPQTPFKGVFRFLSEKCKGNIIDKGVIEAESSSINSSTSSLRNSVQEDGTFGTANEQNQNPWLQFDFKEKRIAITHYSIKATTSWEIGAHPKSFRLEGSNDSSDWDILDEQNNCESLHGNLKIATFSTTKTAYYKFIRIKHIGSNWDSGYNHLYFNQIEFFGNLRSK